ncbi:MAG: FkbM family methyltransferase [Pseudomonadota bacterium]
MAEPATHPAIAATCKGVRVPASPFLNDRRIARINAGRYEGAELNGALTVIRPGERVLELGAGLGIVGAVIARNARPAAVLSFEANPNLIPHIRALHAENGLQDVIDLRQQVLLAGPNPPAHMTFHVRNSFLGSSLIDKDNRHSTPVDVPTARLSDVMADFAPDIIVMDIEGGELDFLAHADLSTIRAVIIEFHPDAYGIDGMRQCKDALRRAGFRRVNAVSTRTVWTCARPVKVPEVADLGPPDPAGGWSEKVEVLHNAIVAPKDSAILAAPCGVQTADGADVPMAAHYRKLRRLTLPFATPPGPLARLEGRYLWGGVFYRNFAHFMAESLSRLWAADRGPYDGVAMVLRRPMEGRKISGFHTELVAAMGIDAPLSVIKDATVVDELVVPGQGFGLGAIAAGTPAFRAHVAANFGRDIAPDGPERLYISRSALPPSAGRLLGEARIETHLRDEGYITFHPEHHDIATQIARYKAAREVIACDGSALHLLAFCSRADQRVAMICRRRSSASTLIARHLTSFTGRPPTVINALLRQYQPHGVRRKRMFLGEPDMAALSAALRDAGFTSGKTLWPELSLETLRAELPDGYAPL